MILRTAALSALALLAVPATALALGPPPVVISAGPNGQTANGPSGGGTISGDNRKARLTAFHSEASNFVAGDTNQASDVFVYKRPSGFRVAGGSLRRVSVTNSGGQANGPSTNPSLDGRVLLGDRDRPPTCVAFQSEASNLTSSDRDTTSDIFVRDLGHNRTILVSRGIGAAATNPSIDGSCKTVGFEAGGRVHLAKVGGAVKSLGSGQDIDLALDGKGVTWVSGGKVKIRRAGHTSTVAPGARPTISDLTPTPAGKIWAVTFHTSASLVSRDNNSGTDVYLRTLRPKGGVRKTDLVSAPARGRGSIGGENENGGLTAFAAVRGFLWFVNHHGSESTLFYRNNNSGNVDGVVHAGTLSDVETTARGNFVVYTADQVVYLKSLGGK
jgi:hypothetical protein